MQLAGIAYNDAAGLVVEIETAFPDQATLFTQTLIEAAPPAARIESVRSEILPEPANYQSFEIVSSAPGENHFTLISPDLATCDLCRNEVFDPAARRFRYPFTNCANCGPRYTIILSIPYDRARTTMRSFPLCAACFAEYRDPADRRFHAEPIACPACGPLLSLPLAEAVAALERGQILAVKGLGGFQLACDALRGDSVDGLRARKRRGRKPFAVMMRNLATVERYCFVSDEERQVLQSGAAPIVLLALRGGVTLPPGIAPGMRHLGVMLPSTPLHHLLFGDALACLVMTSGNISEEPIVTRNDEAIAKLPMLSDRLLLHNRDIFQRADDSVVRVFEGIPRTLRRARGYAPGAIRLSQEQGEVLAVGAEMKNTFCFTKGSYAIPSQHIGDLENYETLCFFEEAWRNLQAAYNSVPLLIAHDLHPDCLGTRWALQRPEPKIAIQHHHAHIASCMAENGLEDRVLGVAFDGTGFGTDGHIWGGEFLLCDLKNFERCAHLRYVALSGGDRAARQTWRMAASHLRDAFGEDDRKLNLPCWSAAPTSTWKLIDAMLSRPSTLTSSAGRLFDAVASICGISQENSFEGESAMLLESAAAEGNYGEPYEMPCATGAETDSPWTIDTRPMIARIARDIVRGISPKTVARCFHHSLAHMIETVCSKLREGNGVDTVCLSGGTFQNLILLKESSDRLRSRGFRVYLHSRVPPNDGGLSLGQAAIAASHLRTDIPEILPDVLGHSR